MLRTIMLDDESRSLFARYSGNPIVTPENLSYVANTVLNPGVTIVNGETLLMMRVEDRRGISHLTAARSKDGLRNWHIDETPTFEHDPENYPEELWGVEDPRLTYIEEQKRWAVAYTAFSEDGPLVSLALTTDFKKFERLGAILPPNDKDAALFPVRFDDRWVIIHRPAPESPDDPAHIMISFSRDMKKWEDRRVLVRARRGAWWDANKIGLSTPPLRTDEGWLFLYHGVKITASGSIYRLGLALLDLEDPSKLIARSTEWVFRPRELYAMLGDVGTVVFPCGWTLVDDEVRMYYGAADSCIALATASLSELLAWLKEHSQLD